MGRGLGNYRFKDSDPVLSGYKGYGDIQHTIEDRGDAGRERE